MNYAERDAASHRDRANVQGYRRDQLNRAREQEEKEKKYAQLMTGYSSTMGYSKPNAIGRGRHFDEDHNLEEYEEEEPRSSRTRRSRSRSPRRRRRSRSRSPDKTKKDKTSKPVDDPDDDPLDSFMASIEANKDKVVSEQKAAGALKESEEPVVIGGKKLMLGRADIDGEGDEDMTESMARWMEEHASKGDGVEDDNVDYDIEGNPIYSWKKVIDPLPPINHAAITYPSFRRNFYTPHSDIQALTGQQIAELSRKLDIKTSGYGVPAPVCSFGHFKFDKHLMAAIQKAGFTTPTPIQSQAIPALLSGRDVIGIARTGSGKTLAYVWPALVHLMAQPELKPDDGPIVLILVPTRELAQQVYTECRKYGRVYNVRVVCAYGGGSKYEQTKALQQGAEIVVATPGRIIDMVAIGATKLNRVTYLVFDEADRMFDMGFEAQVRSVAAHVRPDRQAMLFSATFKKKVERLAREALTDAVRIVHGEVGEANEDVAQEVHIVRDQLAKFPWLMHRLVDFCASGKVLIFVTRKDDADHLAQQLRTKDMQPLLLHGDMFQHDRNEVIQSFRKDAAHKILVATDVAARGLDIPEIRTVINYDTARDIDTHVHRVGRTGRAGTRGFAFTLLTDKDKEFAGHLVQCLEHAGQLVANNLIDLAMQSEWFSRTRGAVMKSQRGNIGGHGLGYVEPTMKSETERALSCATKSRYTPTSASIMAAASEDAGGDGSKPTNRLQQMKSAFAVSTLQAHGTHTLANYLQASYANKFLRADEDLHGKTADGEKKSRWQ